MHRAGVNGSAVAVGVDPRAKPPRTAVARAPDVHAPDVHVTRRAAGRDFFVVGAAKAGTTALHGFLVHRGGIVLPARKETNFYALNGTPPSFTGPLDDAAINTFSIWQREAYEAEFANADRQALQGEVCPWYLYSEDAPRAIAADNPAAKIAMVLRNPVDRAWSAYRHLVADGRETESFVNALALEEMRIRAGWEWFWHLRAVSRYADQVERYIRIFGRGRIRIYRYGDLVRRPERMIDDLLGFIGHRGDDATAPAWRNISGEPRIWLARLRTLVARPDAMLRVARTVVPARIRTRLQRLLPGAAAVPDELDPGLRRELAQEFLPDVRRLEALTGLDLGDWKP